MSNVFVSDALIALGIENYKLEGEPKTEVEFNTSFIKLTGVDENGIAVESTSPEDFGVTWDEVSTKMAALITEKPLRFLREERDRRLVASDWMVLPDRTPTQAQLDYRQALRDITNTCTSLNDVVWPEKPHQKIHNEENKMTTENITINDKEYKVEDLSTEQKYLVSQLQDLNSKQSNLQFQLDQIQAAKTVFGNTLSQLLEETDQ